MHYAKSCVVRSMVYGALMPLLCCACSALPRSPEVDYPATPEAVVRAMFEANATRNMAQLERLVSKDHDMVGYSIGGRKYVGWHELKREMQQEFETLAHLEIPLKELRVRERGDLAWYTAEIDYIRYEGTGPDQRTMVLPLRESGVLERRQGQWVLVQWHESLERAPESRTMEVPAETPLRPASPLQASVDLSGEWEVQEENKTYHAVLDETGRGRYTWQNGMFTTTRLMDGLWEGTWHQPGNDREGGFELHLSADGITAKGRWWYTRVGARSNIPPRQWGGEYQWKRVRPASLSYGSP